jgi:hypothetical protein
VAKTVAGFYGALGHPIPADSYRRLGMELANGSRIEALPGTEKTIRDFSGAALLIVDEAATVRFIHVAGPNYSFPERGSKGNIDVW